MDESSFNNIKYGVKKMIDDFKKVAALVNHLGLEIDPRVYKGRFLLQKLTYLAQIVGINTDYIFTTHVAGPYSKTLTHDYYAHPELIYSKDSEYQLSPEEIESAQKLVSYCDFNGSLALLESTSTFAIIMDQVSYLDDNEINRIFKIKKPHITNKQRIIGLNKAKQLLFKEEYLTEELKEEMDLWDSIE